MTEVGPLEVGEIKAIKFDFTTEAGAEAILSAQTVTCVVVSGTDPSPDNVKLGLPTIDGPFVVQKVQPGVVGCVYKLRALASDATGLRHAVSSRLSVVQG